MRLLPFIPSTTGKGTTANMAQDRSEAGLDNDHCDPIGAKVDELVPDTQFYDIDPKEESKVVWKLDCVIMPLMALVYFFQCQPDSPFQ